MIIPDWPGWLACGVRMPQAGDGDGFADCAAGAAELADHEAYDQQEAKGEKQDCRKLDNRIILLRLSRVIWFEVVTIQIKATEQYFNVVLFIMLYKVVLTFKSLDQTLVCDHSNES